MKTGRRRLESGIDATRLLVRLQKVEGGVGLIKYSRHFLSAVMFWPCGKGAACRLKMGGPREMSARFSRARSGHRQQKGIFICLGGGALRPFPESPSKFALKFRPFNTLKDLSYAVYTSLSIETKSARGSSPRSTRTMLSDTLCQVELST